MALCLAASVLAIPVGYLVTRSWLDTFVYPIELNQLAFVGTTALLLAAVGVRVAGVGLQAARVDPAAVMRRE